MRLIEVLLHRYKLLKSPSYRKANRVLKEKNRIYHLPRYVKGTTLLLGSQLTFIDGKSFHFIYQEIFEKEIYRFNASSSKPYIIDAGANIGLSVIYLKNLFPGASVVAFEPDPAVFKVLKENIESFRLSDVLLVDKALWNEETTLNFFSEGADAGRIRTQSDKKNITSVSAVSLKPYLQKQRVDFLKVDIEGAETVVLKDCAEELHNVDKIFIEYHSFEGHEQTLPELLEILKVAGFRFAISSPGLTSESPFAKVSTYLGMDMQLNIYGYRLM